MKKDGDSSTIRGPDTIESPNLEQNTNDQVRWNKIKIEGDSLLEPKQSVDLGVTSPMRKSKGPSQFRKQEYDHGYSLRRDVDRQLEMVSHETAIFDDNYFRVFGKKRKKKTDGGDERSSKAAEYVSVSQSRASKALSHASPRSNLESDRSG